MCGETEKAFDGCELERRDSFWNHQNGRPDTGQGQYSMEHYDDKIVREIEQRVGVSPVLGRYGRRWMVEILNVVLYRTGGVLDVLNCSLGWSPKV